MSKDEGPTTKALRPGASSAIATLLLAAGVIVLAAFFAPLAPCPNCEGTGRMEQTDYGSKGPAFPLADCPMCSGRGRVSLLKRCKLWLH